MLLAVFEVSLGHRREKRGTFGYYLFYHLLIPIVNSIPTPLQVPSLPWTLFIQS